jgi:hypothetical protein
VSHFKLSITAGAQNPNLLLTMTPARVSDASANAMQEAWTRKVATGQRSIKELWEDLIYKPLCVQEGLDEDQAPELMWGVPEVQDPEQQIADLTKLLQLPVLNPTTRFDLENIIRQKLELEPLSQQQLMPAQQPPQQPQQTLEAPEKEEKE